MSDYMAWADDTAADMRDYYEANKPLRWWQKRRVWNDIRADNLMLGLLDIALTAERKRKSTDTGSGGDDGTQQRVVAEPDTERAGLPHWRRRSDRAGPPMDNPAACRSGD